MDHVAIMRKSWNLLGKILSGEKRIESRWYIMKIAPWDRIKEDDTIYFRNAGEPVKIRAQVEKVLQYDNFSEGQLKEILDRYAGPGAIYFTNPKEQVFEWAKKRKYCILIFLKNPERVEPFEVDKRGFGVSCAWMAVGDINTVRKN